MTIKLNTKAIRELTRLALPADDGYIYRLGSRCTALLLSAASWLSSLTIWIRS